MQKKHFYKYSYHDPDTGELVKGAASFDSAEYIDTGEMIKNIICLLVSGCGCYAIYYIVKHYDELNEISWFESTYAVVLECVLGVLAVSLFLFIVIGIVKEEIRYREEKKRRK